MRKADWPQRLKECRGGVSQGEFAAKLGVSRSAYVEYEKGSRSPNLETLIRLVEVTGRSLDWLATGVAAQQSAPQLDTDVLQQVIRAVQDEVPDIDALSKAKLISRLYKDRILALSKENEASPLSRGKEAS